MRNMVIEIKNVEHSEKVQWRLFELGYFWGGNLWNQLGYRSEKKIYTTSDWIMWPWETPHKMIGKKYEKVTLKDLLAVQDPIELESERPVQFHKGFVTIGEEKITHGDLKRILENIK